MLTRLYLCLLGDALQLVLSSGELKAPRPGWKARHVCRLQGKGCSKRRAKRVTPSQNLSRGFCDLSPCKRTRWQAGTGFKGR